MSGMTSRNTSIIFWACMSKRQQLTNIGIMAGLRWGRGHQWQIQRFYSALAHADLQTVTHIMSKGSQCFQQPTVPATNIGRDILLESHGPSVEEERIPPRNVLLGCFVMANMVSTKGENALETHERYRRWRMEIKPRVQLIKRREQKKLT
jgi:hypothetical protein